MTQLRCIFAGTPDFAAKALERLYTLDSLEIVGVYTQPDRPAGRGKQLQASPVKQLALQHSTPVFQPVNFKNDEDIDTLNELNADIMIVAAYGIIVPQAVLDAPRLGCINIHASLLPRWRGAAPIQRCIEAGDKETGITIMQMDIGLDTGDMLLKLSMPIDDEDTGSSLHDRLAEQGADAIEQAINNIEALQQQAEKQNSDAVTYAHKLSKQEATIDWQQSAEQIESKVRALNSWPVATTKINDKTIRIWETRVVTRSEPKAPIGSITGADVNGIYVQTGAGVLALTRLQMPGKKALAVADILNGQAALFSTGQQLGDTNE